MKCNKYYLSYVSIVSYHDSARKVSVSAKYVMYMLLILLFIINIKAIPT